MPTNTNHYLCSGVSVMVQRHKELFNTLPNNVPATLELTSFTVVMERTDDDKRVNYTLTINEDFHDRGEALRLAHVFMENLARNFDVYWNVTVARLGIEWWGTSD